MKKFSNIAERFKKQNKRNYMVASPSVEKTKKMRFSNFVSTVDKTFFPSHRLKATFIFFLMLFITVKTVAYFEFYADKDFKINVDATLSLAFGRLDYGTGELGSETNPYLIYNNHHLSNLYTLQNSGRLEDINDSIYFQVSNPLGNPVYVGGESIDTPFEIQSIGSEDFAFISNLKGVTATSPANYVTLPSGEITDTSAIANVKVVAFEGQVDVGLFGNIGIFGEGVPAAPKGSVSNLLLANVQVSTTQTGTPKPIHNNYLTVATPHETNHIGILAGHAQYCTVSNISVYYTQNSGSEKAVVDAFDIGANDGTTRFITTGGIIGFYKSIRTSDDDHTISSDGLDVKGENTGGFGLGVVYSRDIWEFMEKRYFDGNPAPNAEYPLQDTFDAQFYGAGNTNKEYFQIGVFTFVHSKQTKGKDSIAKLWKASEDKDWTIATNNAYNDSYLTMSSAKKYSTTQITLETNSWPATHTIGSLSSASGSGANRYYTVNYTYVFNANNGQLTTTNTANAKSGTYRYYTTATYNVAQVREIAEVNAAIQDAIAATTRTAITNGTTTNVNPYWSSGTLLNGATVNNAMFPPTDYRFMIVAESNGQQYALTKNSDVAQSVKIDTNDFIIPQDMLEYYTFENLKKITYDTNYPDYTQFAARFETPGSIYINNSSVIAGTVNNNTGNTPTATSTINFLVYGKNVLQQGSSTRYMEGKRPIRIYTDGTSFAYASAKGGYFEGIQLSTNTANGHTNFGANTVFRLRRTFSNNLQNNYTIWSEANGFGHSATAPAFNSTSVFKIYAVRTTPNPSNPSESPVDKLDQRQINTPSNPAQTRTYNMSQNCLFYTGNAASTNAAQRYAYRMQPLSSLGWMDNYGEVLNNIDSTLKMADPTAYYLVQNTWFGFRMNIPAPAGLTAPFNVMNIPQGAIGFTVSGHGVRGGADTTSKVNVIVSTDPSKLLDQSIIVSYIPYTTTPANPNAGANPTGITYTNESKTIVGTLPLPPVPGASSADTIPIQVTDGSTTYTAYTNMNTMLVAYTFTVPVSRYPRTYYLEASLGSANFVYLSVEGLTANDNNPDHENDGTFSVINAVDFVELANNRVATVNSSDYVPSFTVPYFGLTRNPNNLYGANPALDKLAILQAKGLKWNIRRFKASDDIHTFNIDVTVPSYATTVNQTQLNTIMKDMNFNFVETPYINPAERSIYYSDRVNTTVNNLFVDWLKLVDLYPR